MPLQSGMIAIGTSGHTVDGREIKASWLTEAAASYDPKLYSAVLDLNHWDPRWAGTYGKVLSVDSVKNSDGDIVLRANIEPNEALIAMSKKEVLFTSMQLQPNFRETGKHYLTALAVTPKPASVGTEQLKFSSDKSDDDALYTDFVKVELSFSEVSEKKDISFFHNLFSKKHEDDPVSKELEQKVDLLAEAVGKLTDQQKKPVEFSIEDAQKLLSEKGFSVTKEPTDDELKAAQKILADQGFSVTKEPTEDELKKAKELLASKGFSVSEKEVAPEPNGKDDTDTEGKQVKITREEYEVLKQKFADSKVTEFNFTASVDQTGGGDDLDFV